ncbi:hypothetical protein DFH27DRAFT_371554 [Peziza echinospora]|nr:hypothetical protein DFH27DRAFT_371554 [Peziza echinospora]
MRPRPRIRPEAASTVGAIDKSLNLRHLDNCRLQHSTSALHLQRRQASFAGSTRPHGPLLVSVVPDKGTWALLYPLHPMHSPSSALEHLGALLASALLSRSQHQQVHQRHRSSPQIVDAAAHVESKYRGPYWMPSTKCLGGAHHLSPPPRSSTVSTSTLEMFHDGPSACNVSQRMHPAGACLPARLSSPWRPDASLPQVRYNRSHTSCQGVWGRAGKATGESIAGWPKEPGPLALPLTPRLQCPRRPAARFLTEQGVT